MAMSFGDYLWETMRSAGYPTPAALARASGLTGSLISKWLNGSHAPTIKTLRQVAGPIGVPLLELVVAAKILTVEEAGLETEPSPPQPADVETLIQNSPMSDEAKAIVAAEIRRLQAASQKAERPAHRDIGALQRRRRA